MSYKTISILSMILIAISGSLEADSEIRPNILMIVIDDMGSGDMSAEGHSWLKTPNFDRLHAQSVRMDDFMVSPSCAPTRAVLMTGAHEFRSGVTHTIYGMEQMSQDRVTLPQILKSAGYRTGCFGKWHLGVENGYAPWKRGFDIGVVAEEDGKGLAQQRAMDPAFHFNGKRQQMKGNRDHLFALEAMDFMKDASEAPFFCYYASYDPHRPHWAEERFVQEAEHQLAEAEAKGLLKEGIREKRLFFAEMIQLDWILGEILDFLDDNGLAENTLVLFVTDNGATDGVDAYNKGMRGHKGTAWVGGTRALSYWRLPGRLEPRDLEESHAHIDVLPTLAEMAGATLSPKAQAQVTGRSAWKQLTGESDKWPERYLHAHLARWNPGERDQHKYDGAMIRRGDYDLVRIETASNRPFYTTNPEFHRAATPGDSWALYHRISDPRQENNLAAEKPELAERMIEEFERWWAESEAHLIHEK